MPARHLDQKRTATRAPGHRRLAIAGAALLVPFAGIAGATQAHAEEFEEFWGGGGCAIYNGECLRWWEQPDLGTPYEGGSPNTPENGGDPLTTGPDGSDPLAGADFQDPDDVPEVTITASGTTLTAEFFDGTRLTVPDPTVDPTPVIISVPDPANSGQRIEVSGTVHVSGDTVVVTGQLGHRTATIVLNGGNDAVSGSVAIADPTTGTVTTMTFSGDADGNSTEVPIKGIYDSLTANAPAPAPAPVPVPVPAAAPAPAPAPVPVPAAAPRVRKWWMFDLLDI